MDWKNVPQTQKNYWIDLSEQLLRHHELHCVFIDEDYKYNEKMITDPAWKDFTVLNDLAESFFLAYLDGKEEGQNEQYSQDESKRMAIDLYQSFKRPYIRNRK